MRTNHHTANILKPPISMQKHPNHTPTHPHKNHNRHLYFESLQKKIIHNKMCTLQLNSYGLASLRLLHASPFKLATTNTHNSKILKPFRDIGYSRLIVKAVGTVPESKSDAKEPGEPPSVDLAFVHSVLLPDGTPDVHFRTACGGQKLRNIMLDYNVELYGPYARPLLNCAGGGTCGTCMVEVIMGKELLNPRTDKEKEKLKKKPKNWRLACQTTVGNPESTGMVVIQQLPEWKGHEWKSERILPSEVSQNPELTL